MDFKKVNIQDLQLNHSIEVNPSTGTATGTVEVPLTEGKESFHPSLSIAYNSSSKNSAFGIGWSLEGLSSISIDFKNGLPKYDDTDQYAFNGSFTLVPQLVTNGTEWVPRVDETADYFVHYYRLKREESFTRFEKWVRKDDHAIHWRARSKDNSLYIYGLDHDGKSKITDPNNKAKVFKWLLESQYDNQGNSIKVEYRAENNSGVDASLIYEKRRVKKFDSAEYNQKYPYRILYGNSAPLFPDIPEDSNNQWLFEVVFDYGQMDAQPYTTSEPQNGSTWEKRADPFSVYNPGFEIRTYRLCKRILMYHHIDELSSAASLTGIFSMNYNEKETGTTLTSVSYTGVRRDLFDNSYSEKQLPELTFSYSEPEVGNAFKGTSIESMENVPQGFNQMQTRWIDMNGGGLPGILTETDHCWYYKQNLGNGYFGKQSTVLEKPSAWLGAYSLGDFDNDGNLNLFTLQGRTAGFYEYDRDRNTWSGFQPFEMIPQTGHTSFIDVVADGFSDLIVETDEKIICYPFKGKKGFDKPYEFSKPRTNGVEYAPIIGENQSLDYFMADMTGDGLPDQVRITNGRVVYFPNMGNGRFGEGVVMENAPVIDFEKSFDAGRIRLYDLDGSGTADLVYIGNGEIRCWYNAFGNGFVEGLTLKGLPYIDNISSANILDLLGKGVPCLVWSNSLTNTEQSPVQYLELTSGVIPRLLYSVENGIGKEIQITYGYSGKHYLEAMESHEPWISKIPFHFNVVDRKTVIDHVTNARFETVFRYRDGHYDSNERTFVCFGLIEQYDSSDFEDEGIDHDTDYTRPILTRTWLHNGMFDWDSRRTKQYYDGDPDQPSLTFQFFEQQEALESKDFMQAYRSLAGKIVRQEVYEVQSGGQAAPHPLQVNQTRYGIRRLQPKRGSNDASFFAFRSESLSIAYEQDPDDPKISHHLSLKVDNYGNIEKEASVSYARRSSISERLPQQSKDYITAALHSFIHNDTTDYYHTGILYETKDVEINHLTHGTNGLVTYPSTRDAFDGLMDNLVSFDEALSSGGASAARLIAWNRTYFWNSALDDVLPLGEAAKPLLAHHEETACFTDNLITNAFSGRVTPAMLDSDDEGNYRQNDGYWWQHTPVNRFNDADKFYTLHQVDRGGGNVTGYSYDSYFLNVLEITDALGNVIQGEIDYNIIQPFRITDQNDNRSEVLYDALGVAKVTTYQGMVEDSGGSVQPYGLGLLTNYTSRNDETFDNILNNTANYLQQAGTYHYYDMDVWKNDGEPLRSIRLERENLLHDGTGNTDTQAIVQTELDYQDGFGRIIQGKRKVEDGPAIHRDAGGAIVLNPAGEPELVDTSDRWLATGHVIFNNKGQPVRQFEPFFTGDHEFEDDDQLVRYGVSSQNYYDAAGRVYRTDYPDGTFSETKFTTWKMEFYDRNDTVNRSLYKTIKEVHPSGSPERMALNRSLEHKETPIITHIDPLGREVVTVETNNNGKNRSVENHFDINGNLAGIRDARDLKAFEYKRDMLGRILYEKSMDAGESWSFHNNDDQTIHTWDSRDVHQNTIYDFLDRVQTVHAEGLPGLDQITERFVYGEDPTVTNGKEKNLRGMCVRHYDQAGLNELITAYPGGNPAIIRRIFTDRTDSVEPDWQNPATVSMGAETYTSKHKYDALGRPVEQILPDQTTRKYRYTAGGGIQKVLLTTADGVLNDEEILQNTTYDAKDLRQSVLLGNGVEIDYSYDSETFRLNRMRARRRSGTARTYQDIRYTYDPVGNMVHFVDEAQQPASPAPAVVEGLNVSSHSEFRYDALYQLIEAMGRVHQALQQHDYPDRSREQGLPDSWMKGTQHITLNNAASVERYTREYEYDEAGNIKSISHDGATQNWNREIWTSATSNRSLPLHDLNDQPVSNPESRFDATGNCIHLPHLEGIDWNYRNNIARVVVIDRSIQGKPNDEEFYVYGGDGTRVRKITQRLVNVASETLEITEKIYLDGCEIKRVTRGGTERLKRLTSKISDGTNKLAIVHSWETDTHARETDDVSSKNIHYQLGNHLGSAALELDEHGGVITYEEFFPFGGTAFVAGRNKREISLKEYRYSGKERDDFTGLYYFGYRYYAHWIGGWISPDPLGPEDSENLYLYVHNNPVNLVDPNGLQSSEIREATGDTTQRTPKNAITDEQSRLMTTRSAAARQTLMSELGDEFRRLFGPGELVWHKDQNYWVWDPKNAVNPSEANGGSDSGGTSAEENVQDDNDSIAGDGQDDTVGSDDESSDDQSVAGELDGSGGGDSEGAGSSEETNVNNGDGNKGEENSTGDGVNPGDGNGGTATNGTGPGSGPKGNRNGGGGDDDTTTGTGNDNGSGNRNGPGRGRGRNRSGNSRIENGQPGGSPQGIEGGQIGGSLGGHPEGQLGGEADGNLEGDINGIPDGTPDGELNGIPENSGSGSQPGEGQQPGQEEENPESQGRQEEQERQGGQSGGDPRTNFMDDITRVAGYFNLEFGDEPGGEAGGVPGGMDLLGWRPPMWVRRTLQVTYIALTVVTTIIPIGKAALALKVAIQGALKAGLRATARKLLTRVASMIPSKAAIRGALSRVRAGIGAGINRLGGVFRRTGNKVLRTIRGSSNPLPGQTLVGSSRSQMRRNAQRIIRDDPNHPLRFLLDNNRFHRQRGLKHHELIDRPEIIQMGHITSNKTGQAERLMLQGAWENQLDNLVVESARIGGAILDQPAISIGGIAVHPQTARFWESIGWLTKGTVESAPRVVF
ncbi:MAG: SpvB/TcaC N-terminal domain-containing protein [Balneolaceae bacterium]